MQQNIAHLALIVKDYDEAIAFYIQKLHFTLIEDTKLDDLKRWVIIAPPNASHSTGCNLLLAKAANQEQSSRIGNQTGGRVFLFMYTDNFQRDYQNLLEKNIKIVREAITESYGTVAVFADLYGNLWDLIEPVSK